MMIRGRRSKISKSNTYSVEVEMMRITSKGQVTIPIEIRERFGFLPHTEVEFVIEGDQIVVRKAETSGEGFAGRLIRHMRGAGSGQMTTDEIMALTRGEDWSRS